MDMGLCNWSEIRISYLGSSYLLGDGYQALVGALFALGVGESFDAPHQP